MSWLKNKIFINLAVIFIIFSSVIIFVIYPAIREITAINKEITAERIKLEQRLALGLNFKKIKQDLAEINALVNELDKIFIKKNEELNFITTLENIARTNNVAVNFNSDFSGANIDENISQISFQINAAGDFSPLVNFIQSVEALPYYFNPDLILASSQQKTENQPLTIQLIGKTYIKNEAN